MTLETGRSPSELATPKDAPAPVRTLRHVGAALVLVALCFLQAPGLVVADTKLDLTVDPMGWLAAATSVWDPSADFGRIQNQNYGYLWPMGPFFVVGDSLELPSWVTQRLWWALILLVGYFGVVVVARRLKISNSFAVVVAGLAYALAPRVLTVLGGISVEAWPGAVLPWVLAPLIAVPTGHERRHAAVSGLAVLMLGAVNAAATVLTLVLPLVWITTARCVGKRRSLLGWWVVAVALASTWWLIPLLVLNAHAFPFLDAIESVTTTAQPATLANAFRGTSHWVAWTVTGDEYTWPAGARLSSGPGPAAAALLLATAGAAGLVRRSTPARRPLGLAFAVGMTGLAIAHVGSATSPLAEFVQGLLDSDLSPLRNVHKWDPVIRLPIVLGLAALLDTRDPAARFPAPARATMVVTLLAAVVVPAANAGLANPRPYPELPNAWTQALDWLDEETEDLLPRPRTLVLPAARFAEQTWGTTRDEVVQPLLEGPWLVRSAVPLGAPGATAWLTEVEMRFSRGIRDLSLADALAAAGVGHVLVRTDLDVGRAGAEPFEWATATLRESPGFERDRVFTDRDGTELEIWQVQAPVRMLDAHPLSDLVVMTGTTPAQASHLGESGPRVSALDLPAGTEASAVLIGDSQRRRAYNPALPATIAYSAVLPAREPPPPGRRVLDPSAPATGDADQVVVEYGSADRVVASSSASSPFDTTDPTPASGPTAAFDRDPQTAWTPTDPLGGVLAVTLPSPAQVGSIALDVTPHTTQRGDVSLTVDGSDLPLSLTDDGRWSATLGGEASTFAVTVAGGQGLVSMDVEGVDLVPRLVTPPEQAGGVPHVVRLTSDPRSRASCRADQQDWTCLADFRRVGEDVGRVERQVTTFGPVADSWAVTVLPVPGETLNSALDQAIWGDGAAVTGSSSLVSHPAARPGAALDDDKRTAWMPQPLDVRPRLAISLTTRREVTGVAVDLTGSDERRTVTVVSDEGSRTARIAPRELYVFPPLGGRRFEVSLQMRETDVEPDVTLPSIREIHLEGLEPTGDRTIDVTCQAGPKLVVNGQSAALSLQGGVSDVLEGVPISAQPCVSPGRLSAGPHTILAAPTDSWKVASVQAGEFPASGAARQVDVLSWTSERREVRLGPGPSAVLRVAEGFEAGWAAYLGSDRIEPLRVEGWQQGWIVPAADGPANVRMVYEPGNTHRTGLAVGLGAAGLLGVLLAVPAASSTTTPRLAKRRGRTSAASATIVSGSWPVLMCGLPGLLASSAALLVPSGLLPIAVAVAGAAGVVPLTLAVSDSLASDGLVHAIPQVLVAFVVAAVLRTALEEEQGTFEGVPGDTGDEDRPRDRQYEQGQHPTAEGLPAGGGEDTAQHQQMPQEDAVGDPPEPT